MCQSFLCSQKRNFSWILQKMRNFPIGKIFVFCRIKLKVCSWLYKKLWHTLWKFQLEITSNKRNIAKKPFRTYMKWTVVCLFIPTVFLRHVFNFRKDYFLIVTSVIHVSNNLMCMWHVNENQKRIYFLDGLLKPQRQSCSFTISTLWNHALI